MSGNSVIDTVIRIRHELAERDYDLDNVVIWISDRDGDRLLADVRACKPYMAARTPYEGRPLFLGGVTQVVVMGIRFQWPTSSSVVTNYPVDYGGVSPPRERVEGMVRMMSNPRTEDFTQALKDIGREDLCATSTRRAGPPYRSYTFPNRPLDPFADLGRTLPQIRIKPTGEFEELFDFGLAMVLVFAVVFIVAGLLGIMGIVGRW